MFIKWLRRNIFTLVSSDLYTESAKNGVSDVRVVQFDHLNSAFTVNKNILFYFLFRALINSAGQ